MDSADQVTEQGRAAYDRRAWSEAFACLTQAHRAGRLAPADLDRLAVAAYLTGRDDAADEYAAQAYRAWVHDRRPRAAARRAAWLALHLLLRGEEVRSRAWSARAEEQLIGVQGGPDPERGFVLMLAGLLQMADGKPAAALATYEAVAELGERFDEPDLAAIGQLGRGEALRALGRVEEAMERLDEAMVAVTAGEVSPVAGGIVYCAVIGECEAVFDLRRARQWTSALDHWCETQPGLVPFRGICRVHRAHLLQLSGEWADAADEADAACALLGGGPAAGEAYYQLAELHRLRGRYDDAERCFREASRWLGDPQPSLALLRLGQRRTGDAVAAVRRALDETPDLPGRARLLPAYVEVMLAAADPAAAAEGAAELARTAGLLGAPLLAAAASYAEGICAIAAGDCPVGLARLRESWMQWRELDAPYESARVRLAMAEAHRQLGDPDSAELELEAAAWVFDHLGAVPDLEKVRRLSTRSAPAGPLTGREAEVLRLVATGVTNRTVGRPALHQREDRGSTPQQHLHQARRLLSGRRHGLRLRARATRG
jgi:tetratricopeptide (TPR) repeat protein